MPPRDKEAMKEYKERWGIVTARLKKEAQNRTCEDKFRQLSSLMASQDFWKQPKRTHKDIEKAMRSWQQLREALLHDKE
jgi:hypothetical protein